MGVKREGGLWPPWFTPTPWVSLVLWFTLLLWGSRCLRFTLVPWVSQLLWFTHPSWVSRRGWFTPFSWASPCFWFTLRLIGSHPLSPVSFCAPTLGCESRYALSPDLSNLNTDALLFSSISLSESTRLFPIHFSSWGCWGWLGFRPEIPDRMVVLVAALSICGVK